MKYEVQNFKTLNYIIRYPTNYEEGKKYPVIFFLHGAGTRGQNIKLLKSNAFFTITEKYDDFPFVTVAPQCNKDTWFDHFCDLKELVLKALDFDFVDIGKVYAMGASMGGYAVWQLAMSMPDVFSAIVPICGGGMYWNANRLVNVNVWAFHGADDTTVLVRETKEMINRINYCGGKAKCTIYENTGHDSWSRTYSDYSVFEWLLKSEKTKNAEEIKNKYDDSDLYG